MIKNDMKALHQIVCALKEHANYETKSKNDGVLETLAHMCEEDLERAHSLTSILLKRLEDQLKTDDVEAFELLFGAKETAIGALSKLSGMLLKFIPLEQEMLQEKQSADDVSYEHLNQQDAEFLEQYIAYTLKNSSIE